mmetsp:Transcript_3282/g.7290  ORF Transcript_3282/g.7290 Transcript_3282/m.7290 type:complete len:167 (+) Transcript_3282:11-511(+)
MSNLTAIFSIDSKQFFSTKVQDKSKQVHDKVSEQLLRSFAHERNLLVTQHVVLAVALLVVASTFILATLGTRVEPALHTVSVTAAGLVIGVALRPRRTATANPTAVAREPALAYASAVCVVPLVGGAASRVVPLTANSTRVAAVASGADASAIVVTTLVSPARRRF